MSVLNLPAVYKIDVQGLNVFYDNSQVLFNINLQAKSNETIAIIGPSGCGKSTFLRCLNRMNDYDTSFNMSGKIILDEVNIQNINHTELCTRVGMVFQKPIPFPKSIYENVAYGPMIHQTYQNQFELDQIVIDSLSKVNLFDEVKDKLNKSALELSGGQQQRLCIARTLAIKPEVILMDEPCASLDPISSSKMENLITELSKNFTIIIVTHSLQQAARVSDKVAFFSKGSLIEFGPTKDIFTSPKKTETRNYLTGRLN